MLEISRVKIPRILYSAVAAVALTFVASAHADNAWLTDFKEAQQKAKSDNKLLLLDFTGSDWCGWCIKLRKEVFSRPEFKDYASKNLVLMEVDFPRAKQIDKSLLQQNMDLADKFGIQGFPTIIVLDGNGKKVGEFGYDAGVPSDSDRPEATPAAFIANIEKLRKS